MASIATGSTTKRPPSRTIAPSGGTHTPDGRYKIPPPAYSPTPKCPSDNEGLLRAHIDLAERDESTASEDASLEDVDMSVAPSAARRGTLHMEAVLIVVVNDFLRHHDG